MRNHSTTDFSSSTARKLAKTEFVQYGNTVLKKTYCPKCKRNAFLLDGKLLCCDLPIGDIPAVSIKVVSAARAKRRIPCVADQVRILEEQENKCFYCDLPFGTLLSKTGKKNTVSIVCWDHYVPYRFSHNNHDYNFVAACQICNGIKGSLIFDTVEEARLYIGKRREKKVGRGDEGVYQNTFERLSRLIARLRALWGLVHPCGKGRLESDAHR